MPIPYIWLGANDEVNGALGTLLQIPVERWTVRPLLGWARDGTNDTFTPALLVHDDNPALQTLLDVLGAVRDQDAALTTAIGTTWRVYRFEKLATTTAVGQVDLADFPSPVRPLIRHKDSVTITLDAPNTASTIGPGGLVTLDSPPRLVITTISGGGGADFSLQFTIKQIDLRKLGFATPFDLSTPVNLDLEYDPAAGQVRVNGVPLDSSSGLDPGPKTLPIGPIFLSVERDGTPGTRLAGVDVPIGGGTQTIQPLVRGIPGSMVEIQWNAFLVRLRGTRLGLAAPSGSADDVLATATFTFPLIQAQASSQTVNALAKLVPAQAQQTAEALLTPLSFRLTLKRPTTSLEVAPVLVALDDVTSGAARLVRDAIGALRAVFDSDSTAAAELTSLLAPLKELSAEVGSAVTFVVQSVQEALDGDGDLIAAFRELDAFNTRDYPLPLALLVKGSGAELLMLLVLHLDLWDGRLADDRSYFYLSLKKGEAAGSVGRLDLTAFAVEVPSRTGSALKALGLPSKDAHDGYLDFGSKNLVLDFVPKDRQNRPSLTVYLPGDLNKNPPETGQHVRLLLDDFDPEAWPEKGPNTLQLRLGAQGLTVAARADTVNAAAIPVPGVPDGPLKITLVDARDGLQSGLVVKDNVILYANLAGRMAVPGFESLEADVRFGLRRDANSAEGPPHVTAEIDLARTDRKPLARLKVPFLKAQLDSLRVALTWQRNGTASWNINAWASGAISVVNELGSTGGVSNLDQPRAIPFQDVDLIHLHQGKGQVRLGRAAQSDPAQSGPAGGAPSTSDETSRFELLDGQFRVEFTRSVLGWDLAARTFDLTVERARFEFQASSDELDVAVEAGQVSLHLDGNNRSLSFSLPSYLHLDVRLGTQIAFSGEVGWVDNAREHFFRADGRLRMTGFPEVAGAMKLGTGIKDDGSTAPNLALFGELPAEADLFAGVVLKRVGLGLGLNNQLAALGNRPDPRTILANLDRVDPKQSRNWSFVSQKGIYVSVVATATLASNRGVDTLISAYVAKLLLSIDTNIDVVAVGQVWLFSSLEFVDRPDNARRPTLQAVAQFKPREKTFSLLAETGTRPAIQANKTLAELLTRARARFSFYLSTELADYFLEELSYRDELFGVSVQAFGSYRIAISRSAALLRALLSFKGDLPRKELQGGIGGFSFSGSLQLDADFGGLVSSSGLAAYGRIRAAITFRVSAFINVPTLTIQLVTFSETFSITISIPYLSCKRWRCKWKTREISETVTVSVTVPIPVIKIEPYHLPETSLDLVLEGQVGFNESGGLGFSGTLTISVSICGHKLEISPRFDFRPDVVRSVQQRVAAVQDRINRLRGLPARPSGFVADFEPRKRPPEETWYYYTRRSGDNVLHLLVPSPEEPTWWYTPHATQPGDYANLPRDTANPAAQGGASEIEREHLSPFRDAVTRIVLPFENAAGDPALVVDLAMPWDRGNADALPGTDVPLTDEQRIALVRLLTDTEAAFLNTAAVADDQDQESTRWAEQEDDPARVSLTGVEVVSDPRPETGARVFWTLTDQMTRPEGVLPFRYRPVEELVAEGFRGVDRRDDIHRLLRYETVRRRAARQSRHEAADPRPTRGLQQARSALLSTILADFGREGGPRTYGPIDEIQLVRTDDGLDRPVVSRRRAAIPVFPEGNDSSYTVRLTHAILENSTELDLEPLPNQLAVKLSLTWTNAGEPSTEEVDLPTPDPGETDPTRPGSRHFPFTTRVIQDPLLPLTARIIRKDENSTDSLASPKTAILIFEPVPAEFAALKRAAFFRSRQVGLIAVTKAVDKLRLRPEDVRIVRNESLSTDSVWAHDVAVRVVTMFEETLERSVAAIQDRVTLLPPCQEFLEGDGSSGPRVRVRLPVLFEETLLKTDLPRLNGFEIHRQLPGDPMPLKLADAVPPSLRLVEVEGRNTLLIESFLFGEDLPYDRETGRFTGPARALVADLSQARYFLRAVPFGNLPTDHEAPLKPWPGLGPHVPPERPGLPALGIVVGVDSLIEPAQGPWNVAVHLVDERGATWTWPAESWDALELWADPGRIRSSGPYAIEDEPAEVDPQAAGRKAVRVPSDLAAERLPESVSGMVKLGEIARPVNPLAPPLGRFDAGDNRPLRPGKTFRLYVRPSVAAEQPLVQPLSVFLIRSLPDQIEENTPMLRVDRLELVSQAELRRILNPISPLGEPLTEAWVSGVDLTRRTKDDDPLERFRIIWDHLGDLDAGVEVLTQDADEPHRVGRMLVTAREEAIFQVAIRDFGSPALWRAHPEPPILGPAWPTLATIQSTTPSTPTDDLTPLLLWRDQRNPAIARIQRAREGLRAPLIAYLSDDTQPALRWLVFSDALAEYIAALLAYQRTPLAPADAEDRLGIDLLISAGRATLLGLKVDPLLGGSADQLSTGLTNKRTQEANLTRNLDDLASIDLSAMTVDDSPGALEAARAKLRDLDLARKFAAIVTRRQAIADELASADPDSDPEPPGAESERLPGFQRWQGLFETYRSIVAASPGDLPLTTSLVASFGDDTGPDLRSTGRAGAEQIAALTGLEAGAGPGFLRDPVLLLDPESIDPRAAIYREQVAGLVPQVAGLTAALDTLGNGARALGWTLLRRPHHQLTVVTDGDGSRKPPDAPEALKIYLPDATGGSNKADVGDRPPAETRLPDEALVVPFANLLERLGFAVDLAVIDNLNQPLSQRRLVRWVAGQPWAAVRASIGESRHEIVVLAGREPDTDRDQLETRQLDEDQALGYAFAKLVVVPRSVLADLIGRTGPESSEQADFAAVRAWLKARSLVDAGDDELRLVQRMAKAFWTATAGLNPESNEVGQAVVETRGRRWATVPVVGSRAHIDWTVPDTAGRSALVGVRRVSRYEGLLRWARGSAVPTLSRIYHLNPAQRKSLTWKRRLQDPAEEPSTLPVLVSPHPTRVDFIYALPNSGARSTVSGLSALRTGYRGLAIRFGHARVDDAPITHDEMIGALSAVDRLDVLTVNAVTGPSTWNVTLGHIPGAFDGLVVFSPDRSTARLATSFVQDANAAAGTGELRFPQQETPFVLPGNFSGPLQAFAMVATDRTLDTDGFQGTLRLVGTDHTRFRVVRLSPEAERLDDGLGTLEGQVLVVLDNAGRPAHARVLNDFDPSTQTVSLNPSDALPSVTAQTGFRLLTGGPLPSRDRVNRSGAGAPVLFRHERLVSLPALPYYRKFTLAVNPQFDVEGVPPAAPTASNPVFATRKPSLIAARPARLFRAQPSTTEVVYTIRVVLSQQGDFLTPQERQAAREIDPVDPLTPSTNPTPVLLANNLSAADLPDLASQYQILWRLPDNDGNGDAGAIYAQLADVVLPGHTLWKAASTNPSANPVMVRNANGPDVVKLIDPGPGDDLTRHLPLTVWRPSPSARPVFSATLQVSVTLPAGQLFADADRAVLQVSRDGYSSRPLPIRNP
jgi:hypothetical protein